MDKSSKENNITRSSSQTRRSQATDRSILGDCTEAIQKYSNEFKDLSRDLKAYQTKINKHKENIEVHKRLIQTGEIEIEKIQNNIAVLQQQTENVKIANEKIVQDTDIVLDEKQGLAKEIRNNDEVFSVGDKLAEKVKIERKILEKMQLVNEKMRKQILVEQKIKEEARNENAKIKKKIVAVREQIEKCKLSAVDMMNKLSL